MASGRDDDALTWEGDDDPTLDVGDRAPADAAEPAPEPATLPEGWSAVGKGSETVPTDEPADATASDAEEPETDGRAPMGNVALVTIGILGGVYLLFTIAWVIGGFRLAAQPGVVSDAMLQASHWLAVLAPAIWFGTVFVTTKRSPSWVRILWLIAGVLLLVPWPFVSLGPVG